MKIKSLNLSIKKKNQQLLNHLKHNSDVDIHHLMNIYLLNYSKTKQIGIVKFLIDNGANVNYNNSKILIGAINNEQYEMCDYLIENNGFISFNTIKDLFMNAVKSDDVKKLEYLLDKFKNSELDYEWMNSTALQIGHRDCVKTLVRSGVVGPNSPECKRDDNYGFPILYVSEDRDDDMMKFFLEYGANVNVCHGEIIERYIRYENTEMLKLFIEHGMDMNTNNGCLIEYALKMDNFNLLKCFVDNGSKLDFDKKYFKNVKTNCNDIINYLIDNGISVEITIEAPDFKRTKKSRFISLF